MVGLKAGVNQADPDDDIPVKVDVLSKVVSYDRHRRWKGWMMRTQRVEAADDCSKGRANIQDEAPAEFPVREYIGAMSLELAQMARWDGDEALGRLLDSAASLAAEPTVRKVVERAEPVTPRPA